MALEGHKDAAGNHFLGVISHSGSDQAVISLDLTAIQAAEQLSQNFPGGRLIS